MSEFRAGQPLKQACLGFFSGLTLCALGRRHHTVIKKSNLNNKKDTSQICLFITQKWTQMEVLVETP